MKKNICFPIIIVIVFLFLFQQQTALADPHIFYSLRARAFDERAKILRLLGYDTYNRDRNLATIVSVGRPAVPILIETLKKTGTDIETRKNALSALELFAQGDAVPEAELAAAFPYIISNFSNPDDPLSWHAQTTFIAYAQNHIVEPALVASAVRGLINDLRNDNPQARANVQRGFALLATTGVATDILPEAIPSSIANLRDSHKPVPTQALHFFLELADRGIAISQLSDNAPAIVPATIELIALNVDNTRTPPSKKIKNKWHCELGQVMLAAFAERRICSAELLASAVPVLTENLLFSAGKNDEQGIYGSAREAIIALAKAGVPIEEGRLDPETRQAVLGLTRPEDVSAILKDAHIAGGTIPMQI